MNDLTKRRISSVVHERMRETPVLLLEGPRSVGKSTLLSGFATAIGRPIFDLDQLAYRQMLQTNPSLIAEDDGPVLIDEYQRLPELLDTIKARLNQGTSPGMFILTGSTSFDSLPPGTQALTGRLQRLPVMPLTQTEIDDSDNHLIEQAFAGQVTHTSERATSHRTDYVQRITRGGMPLALDQGSLAARTRWFEAAIRASLERDAGALRRIGRTTDLRDVLTRTVGQTASLLNISKVTEDVQPSWGTTADYIELLESLFLIKRLPAWGTTLLPRSIDRPKIHVIDSGVGAHLLRLSPDKLQRLDPSAMTEFGHLLESFVVQEIIRQTQWMDDPVTAGYWRTKDDLEVDLVLERYDGAVVAVEVKASETVNLSQLAPLKALRDRLGSAFVAGFAFNLGPLGYQADDRIHVLPVERLWT